MKNYKVRAKVIGIYTHNTLGQGTVFNRLKGDIDRIGYVDSKEQLHELVKPAVALLDAAEPVNFPVAYTRSGVEVVEIEGVGRKRIDHMFKDVNYYVEAHFIFKGDIS